ncbi:MAG: hypothetical protein H7Y18_18100 [Clostridiaceae bacterium]|nr:hypothetical protein [Clostridiaceae bacterium]
MDEDLKSDLGKYYFTEPKILGYAIEVVNSEFEIYYSNKLVEILTSKRYIPQEAIAL